MMTFDAWLKKRDPSNDIGWPGNDQMREAWNAAIESAYQIANAGAIAAIEHQGAGSTSDRMARVAAEIYALKDGERE